MTTPLSVVRETKPRKRTQTERILDLLKKRGERGVTNRELNQIAWRFSARIHELRHDKYVIETVQESPGFFRFVLKREPES